MQFIVVIVTTLYAFLTAFDAWTVIRRQRWLGLALMGCAALLILAAAIFITPSGLSLPFLALSLAACSSISLLKGYMMLGRVRIRQNILRTVFALALFSYGMFVAIQFKVL